MKYYPVLLTLVDVFRLKAAVIQYSHISWCYSPYKQIEAVLLYIMRHVGLGAIHKRRPQETELLFQTKIHTNKWTFLENFHLKSTIFYYKFFIMLTRIILHFKLKNPIFTFQKIKFADVRTPLTPLPCGRLLWTGHYVISIVVYWLIELFLFVKIWNSSSFLYKLFSK